MWSRGPVRWTVAGLLIVLAVLLVGPQQLGGPLAVVSTYGISMEPTYRASDLVLVARSSDYEVGDVVAYRSDELQRVVLHRIVARDGDAFVTQGDNNDWLDPDRPSEAAMIGTAQLRFPQLGRLVAMPAPLRATLVAGLALAAFTVGGRSVRPRPRRPDPGTSPAGSLKTARPRRRHGRRPRPGEAGDLVWAGWPATVGLVAALLAALGLAAATTAFLRPGTTAGPIDAHHQGSFTYGAETPPGAVYPDGEIATGDTVFLRLVDRLHVGFEYHLDGPIAVSEASGRLWLELADGSGWSDRTPLDAATLDGPGSLHLDAELDLAAIRRTLDEVAETTGSRRGQAAIVVSAEIGTTGAVAGTTVTDTFNAELGFQLDEYRLQPQGETTGTTTTDRAPFDALAPAAAPARLGIGRLDAEVSDVRRLAPLATAAAILVLAVAAWAARRRRALDALARVRTTHRRRLLPVTAVQLPAGYGMVDVTDVATLAALADEYDRPLLHHRDEGGHTFLVEGDATVYRHRAEHPAAAVVTPSGAGDTADGDQAAGASRRTTG